MSEGYGLNRDAVQYLIDQGTEVLITVDCGISSYDIVNEFKDNLTMIITDHHEPPENIPPAFAVLNPKQPDCPYPFKQLAGAGVAYKLGQALWQRVMKEPLSGYIELTALGTVADVVPLTGENRIIVRYGLQAIRDGRNIGLQALIADSGVDPEKITADRIAFSVAPRLNASGRISHADLGVRLLLERDSERRVLWRRTFRYSTGSVKILNTKLLRRPLYRSWRKNGSMTMSSFAVVPIGIPVLSALRHRASKIGFTGRPSSSVSTMALAKDHVAAFLVLTCMRHSSQLRIYCFSLVVIPWQRDFHCSRTD